MFSRVKHLCQRPPVTLHGVVFDILVGSENRVGLAADGFSEYELPALACVALLLMSFPWVGAPVGLGAALIVRRAGGEGYQLSPFRSLSSVRALSFRKTVTHFSGSCCSVR
jgi:hypothetical protein